MAKRETVLGTTIRADGMVLVEFDGFDPMLVDTGEFPLHVQLLCRAYGAREKITNAASLPRDPKTGRSATPAEKRDAVMKVLDAMRAGEWEVRARVGGSDDAVLIAALVEVTGNTRDAIRAMVDSWDGATKTAMQADANVAPIFDRMKKEAAARAAMGVDTASLLAKAMQT